MRIYKLLNQGTVVASVITILPVMAQDSDCVELNNRGVAELNRNHFDESINLFLKVRTLDPNYELGRQNLVVAYTYKGNSLSDAPWKALKYFHLALFVATNKGGGLKNFRHYNDDPEKLLNATIRKLNKNPKSFSDRVALGDQLLKENDLEGAVIEYEAALLLKSDKDVAKRLASTRAKFDGMSLESLKD